MASRRPLLVAAAALAAISQPPRAALAGAAELATRRWASAGVPGGLVRRAEAGETHQYEALLEAPALRGVKLGLTVDPVKIGLLEQFGTLATVTDRVLTVEEGRDGVTDVKLRGAAEERPAGTLYYAITYEVIAVARQAFASAIARGRSCAVPGARRHAGRRRRRPRRAWRRRRVARGGELIEGILCEVLQFSDAYAGALCRALAHLGFALRLIRAHLASGPAQNRQQVCDPPPPARRPRPVSTFEYMFTETTLTSSNPCAQRLIYDARLLKQSSHSTAVPYLVANCA